jgi:CheY-like chemotaxis protein
MRRILIVDDEPLIREVLAEVLADEGYAVHSAADGQEAVEAVSVETPDLVITDVLMPRLSGWELLDRVRQHHPLLPVIVISAVGQRAARPERLSDHTVFLAKPFALDDLLALVSRLTGNVAS